jgi:uncharacterized protein (UPF0332 family)
MVSENQYKAEMTFRQFVALTNYIKFHDLEDQIIKNSYFQKVSVAKNINPGIVKKWIFNGWNTERMLRATDEYVKIEDNSFALQWSFPQAYYSVFMLTLAYMTLNGQNTNTHSGIMDKFSEFATSGKYPQAISFCCKGTKKIPEYVNIKKHPSNSSLSFNHDSKESCETQICQFLNTTRQILLDEKRHDKNIASLFTTGKGANKKTKKRLSESDWTIIAGKIKETNLLHLLYRKRIKSNYRDIDTFNNEFIKATNIHKSLIDIVKNMNYIHEMYICKMIGIEMFDSFYKEYSRGNEINFLKTRKDFIFNSLNKS